MIDERFPYWDIDVEKGTIYSLKYKRYIGAIDKYGYVHVMPPKGYKHEGFHQYIWMCVNGDIPEGYDIHHIDHNPSNNSIYNLELIESTKHRSEHKIGFKHYLYGKHHTDETKKKMSKAKKGIIFTEEHRRKMSEAHKGYKHSAETKKKMSQNNTKKIKVGQYTLEGELVKVWCSARECGRNGYNSSHISACCRGELKTHKKFKWKYLNE